ncbi:MAG: Fe-Mn family superoxide dismutase [Candidatus Paceibacterota bacterium]|jgi:Fe-Mn family superoxide dismutase
MINYEEKKLNIPELKGISKKTIDEHLKLYAGYVKNTNGIFAQKAEMAKNPTLAYASSETQRRLGFEFDGMRNHEYYFALFEDGAKSLSDDSSLKKAIEKEFGSFENWLADFKTLAMTRGPGWAILYKDGDKLLNSWVDEHHLGQLTGLSPVVALDMWEHAYMIDYIPGDKKRYIEAFFENLNWEVAERFFTK